LSLVQDLCAILAYLSPFVLLVMIRPDPISTLFPYTTLFRSLFEQWRERRLRVVLRDGRELAVQVTRQLLQHELGAELRQAYRERSEEHTSELQSLAYLVCRLLLEKKNEHKSAG